MATSVDELIAGASSREPMTSGDSKSGARFERVVIEGVPYVLKHVDRRDDWLMRQTGDLGCVPIRVWETGVVDLAPDCIDATVVGAARTGTGGAVLMRDVGPALVPEGDEPLPLAQHLRFLDHLAAFHAACWGWRDTVGLLPFENRYALFGPHALACEEALGYPQPVPKIAAEGWQRLGVVSPAFAAALAPLRDAPYPVTEALLTTPQTFLHGDWKLGNLGTDADGRTVLVDWSMCGSGAPLVELAHYLALNTARLPVGHTKDDAIAAYRASLEARGVDTEGWWDRQLGLALLGHVLLLGWEKAFDETGAERAWWEERALAAIRDHLDV